MVSFYLDRGQKYAGSMPGSQATYRDSLPPVIRLSNLLVNKLDDIGRRVLERRLNLRPTRDPYQHHSILLDFFFQGHSPAEMDPPILDMGRPRLVIQTRPAKRLGRNADNLLFAYARRVVLELRLDVELPLALHNLLDTRLAETVPPSSQAGLADALEGFVDEDAAAEATFGKMC